METLLAAETTLSLIPSLVKMSPLSTPDLTLIRLVMVAGFSLIGSNLNELYNLDIQHWLIPTAITISHIVSSYLGFKIMPNVWSQVLFYSYPFMILLGSFLFFGQAIKLFDILWFIPMFVSIYFLYSETTDPKTKLKKEELKTMSLFDWSIGTVALLTSAATEAAYFLYFTQNPIAGGSWNRLGVSYIGAALLYAVYYGITGQYLKHNGNNKTGTDWLFAILWNFVICGFGYWARFYSIDKVIPLVYSALSYTGLITGYIFAVLFGIDSLTKVDIISLIGVLTSILGLTITPHLLSV